MIARKTFTAAVAAIAVSASMLATIGDAQAGHRRHHHSGGNSGAVVAGIIGGLAIGALVASSSRARSYDRGYAPVYGGGYPYGGYDAGYRAAYGGGYGYANSGFSDDHRSSCFVQKQRVFDEWGNYVGKRRVRVCQ